VAHLCAGIVSELFTEGPILRVGVSTSVWVMEADVQEEWAENSNKTSYWKTGLKIAIRLGTGRQG
jgi:hypothetical protein